MRLKAAVAALALAQVVHFVAPGESAAASGFGVAIGFGGLGLSVVAVGGVWSGRRWGATAALAAGVVVPLGYLVFHAIPVKSGVIAPYFGPGSATAAQWISVLLSVAAGLWCAIEARRTPGAVSASAR